MNNSKATKNHTNPMKSSSNSNTLCLFVENKFGVLEKVIGTFTLRGYKIENLVCSQSKFPNLYDMRITLNCTDKDLERIVKILHNQIHVLDIRLMMEEKATSKKDMAKAG